MTDPNPPYEAPEIDELDLTRGPLETSADVQPISDTD